MYLSTGLGTEEVVNERRVEERDQWTERRTGQLMDGRGGWTDGQMGEWMPE